MAPSHCMVDGGVYVHVPFCKRKCPYCSFYSTAHDHAMEAAYLKGLQRDIIEKVEIFGRVPFNPKTLYIGGGTPSVLSPATIERMVNMVLRHLFHNRTPVELTFECNPESTSQDLFALLRDLGVNRLSIGVQDFTEKGLGALRRPHSVGDALESLELARQAGFKNISIDLIFGWPGQAIDDLMECLSSISTIKDEIRHVSYYELSIEEGTEFFTRYQGARGSDEIPSWQEDMLYEFTLFIEACLKEMGFCHYEISNFAVPGYECHHNIGYWENRPYVGLGPGAVSYLPPRRWMNALMHNEGRATEWEEELDHEAMFRETVVIGLRMLKGVSVDDLKDRFGLDPLSYYGNILEQLVDDGFLGLENQRLYLTHRGRMVSNQILAMLV